MLRTRHKGWLTDRRTVWHQLVSLAKSGTRPAYGRAVYTARMTVSLLLLIISDCFCFVFTGMFNVKLQKGFKSLL